MAKDELVVTLGRKFEDFSIELFGYKVFKNNEKGFFNLVKWTNELTDKEISLRFIMEATGVYHQKFAFYLEENKYTISIVLPNKISNYFRTLEVKTITDKSCSQAIAQFGLERELENWKKPSSIYSEFQQLTRERDQIVQERSILKNQIHAEKTEAFPNSKSLERMQTRIRLLKNRKKKLKQKLTK